jgi:hypothetical protein
VRGSILGQSRGSRSQLAKLPIERARLRIERVRQGQPSNRETQTLTLVYGGRRKAPTAYRAEQTCL